MIPEQLETDLNNLINYMHKTEENLMQECLYAAREYMICVDSTRQDYKLQALQAEAGRKYLEMYRNGLMKVIAIHNKEGKQDA